MTEGRKENCYRSLVKSDLDVLGIQETHLLDEGTEENDVWECLRGWVCGVRMSESYKRKKEVVAILLSERMKEEIMESRSVNSSNCQVMQVRYAQTCVGDSVKIFTPVNAEGKKGRTDMDEFSYE